MEKDLRIAQLIIAVLDNTDAFKSVDIIQQMPEHLMPSQSVGQAVQYAMDEDGEYTDEQIVNTAVAHLVSIAQGS
jgi:hypothetical protein